MYILSKVWMGIILLIQSIWDLREKEIPTIVSVIGGVMGLCLSIATGRNGIEILCACIPGVFCFLCCKVTKGAVGYGDAILLTAMGMVYSLGELGVICCVAFGLASVVALGLLVIFRKKGNYEIPFVPFLAIGWAVELWIFCGGEI